MSMGNERKYKCLTIEEKRKGIDKMVSVKQLMLHMESESKHSRKIETLLFTAPVNF